MASKSRDQVRLLTGHSPFSEKHSDTHDSKPVLHQPDSQITGILVREQDGTYRFEPLDEANEKLLHGIHRESTLFVLKPNTGPTGQTAVRILGLLETNGPLTPREISARLEDASPRYIYRLLRKMTLYRIIASPRHGLYCLRDDVRVAEKLRTVTELSQQRTKDKSSKGGYVPKDYELTIEFRKDVDGIVQDHLIRSGGACLIQVRTISRSIRKKHPEIRLALLNRMIDSHLANNDNAEYWEDGTSEQGSKPYVKTTIARRIYSIRLQAEHLAEDDGYLRNTTISEAIEEVIRCTLEVSHLTLANLTQLTKIRERILIKAIERLVGSQVLRDESGALSLAPQVNPERIRVIRSIADNGRADTIRSLLLDYAKNKLTEAGKPLFDLRRLRKHLREQLPFLTASEIRSIVNEILDTLMMQGTVSQLDGSVHKFNPSLEAIPACSD